MSNNERKLKTVITFTLYKDLLDQTKYENNQLEELLIDLLEGDYKEDIFLNGCQHSSPIGSVCIDFITEDKE